MSAGLPLRAGVTRDDYNKLDDRKNRRKKRSLRMFINNQKRSPAAHTHAWKTIYQYIVDNKLLRYKFKISIRGSNFKLTQKLAKNITRQHPELNVYTYEAIDKAPHNGCKLKIKKRKKNKGKNRRRKRLATRPRPLKKARDVRLRLFGPGYGADAFLMKKLMQDPFVRLIRTTRMLNKRETQVRINHDKSARYRATSTGEEKRDNKYNLKGNKLRRAIVPSQSFRQFKLRRRYFKNLKTKQQRKKQPVKAKNDINIFQSNAN